MNKEQRKFLLIVKLNGIIPWKLYKKYNHCTRCGNRFNRAICGRTRLKNIGVLVNGIVVLRKYCRTWESKNEGIF